LSRIAIYHNLPSGGAKRLLFETTKRLASKHSIDVYTLTCANHEFSDIRPFVDKYITFDYCPLPLLSSPLRRLNQASRIFDLLRLRLLSKTIAKKLVEARYDIILIHPCQIEISPSILSYLQGANTIYYCHEPFREIYETLPGRPYDGRNSIKRKILNKLDPIPTLYNLIYKRLDYINTRNAGKILVNSEFTRKAVRRIYQVDANVSYPGVDIEKFIPMSVNKDDMVLSVGSLTPLKGFDFLIMAIAKIPTKDRPKLVIVSNFQNQLEKEFLEQLAHYLETDLKLVCNIDDDDLVKLYNKAKITVYSPIREPFGLVPLESMACCTPVVAVGEGGIQETLITNHTGILVERDPVLFAESVQCLLSNTLIAKEYGHNGRDHVQRNWTWDKAATTLENYLIGPSSN
jgi:glycosyltransferase involved in cell wall biosynthesis